MNKMREYIYESSCVEQNGLSGHMERHFGDLEEEIKEIVVSDVEDMSAVDREDLRHLPNCDMDSAETTEVDDSISWDTEPDMV